jgi:hypothetical protein
MKKTEKLLSYGLATALLLLGASTLLAQAPPGGGGQGGGRTRGGNTPGGGRGNFDMNAFMDRMMTEAQKRLEASDDEWKVIRPLLETVTTKQREAYTGRGSLMSLGRSSTDQGGQQGGGRTRGGGPPGSTTEQPREYEALRTVIDQNGSPDELKQRMANLREYRKKKEVELQDAREKLRQVLTAKQEAQLMLAGILD